MYKIRHKNMYKRLAVINYTIFKLLVGSGKWDLFLLFKAGYFYSFSLLFRMNFLRGFRKEV